jgi:uncharacterized protein (DUF1330 family)
MSAYIIVDVEVTHPTEYEDYKRLVPGTLEPYGGRFIVRGGETQTLEGSWRPNRMVILEFPSVERAKAWWSSADYAQAKALRQRYARSELVVVAGV